MLTRFSDFFCRDIGFFCFKVSVGSIANKKSETHFFLGTFVCGLSQNLNENHFWFLAFSEDARGRGKGERAEGGNERRRREGGGGVRLCARKEQRRKGSIYLN